MVEKRVPQSLEQLFREQRGHLVVLAGLLVHDKVLAEDLAQEAFIRFAQRAPRMSPPEQARYLRRILINLTHSHFRRRSIAARMARHEREATTDVTSAAGLLRADQRRVAAAVQALPRRQRECVILRYWAQMSDPEIAVVLGISVSSAKTSLHRAKGALTRSLGDSDDI